MDNSSNYILSDGRIYSGYELEKMRNQGSAAIDFVVIFASRTVEYYKRTLGGLSM
jgi:hypothetical protein